MRALTSVVWPHFMKLLLVCYYRTPSAPASSRFALFVSPFYSTGCFGLARMRPVAPLNRMALSGPRRELDDITMSTFAPSSADTSGPLPPSHPFASTGKPAHWLRYANKWTPAWALWDVSGAAVSYILDIRNDIVAIVINRTAQFTATINKLAQLKFMCHLFVTC
jgi:hypothetical protein